MATKPKVKRLAPICKVTAAERARQFEDFYSEENVLFCKYCQHSLDFTRIDTLKDHLKSKKHGSCKESVISKGHEKAPKQQTLETAFKSKDLRDNFILDFVKMCTVADIPLEKSEKMKGFIQKHCKQGGCLPQSATLRNLHVPRLFEEHFKCLKGLLENEPVSIIADETTDIRDHSILNVVAGVRGSYYLIDVVTMQACNHATLSQSVIKAVTGAGISFDNIISFVTDSAAYCKKAFREVLHPVFPHSIHVLCLAHILNLAGEIFQNWPDFSHMATLVSMMKSAFFKKPARKARFLAYLDEYLPPDQVKLPPEPVSTRWNSWINAVTYHATHLHVYAGFFQAESSKGMAVERIIELCTHKELYPEIMLQMHFIKENCQRLMHTLTSMEATKDPLACSVYNTMENLKGYLSAGSSRDEFGTETDRLLSQLPAQEKEKAVKSFRAVYAKSLSKLLRHWEIHPAKEYYKAARLFDPRQIPAIQHNITEFSAIPGLENASQELRDEFIIYTNADHQDLSEDTTIVAFWKGASSRYPHLSQLANKAIWMPTTSVDVERSFSQYKHIMNDRRTSLTDHNTKQLLMLYFNGDIENRFLK